MTVGAAGSTWKLRQTVFDAHPRELVGHPHVHARGELAHIIRLFMDDQPIVDDPDSPGVSRIFEIHRGSLHPPVKPPN